MCQVNKVVASPLLVKEAKAWERMHQHLINGINQARLNGKFGRRPKKIDIDIINRFSNSDCSTKQKIAKEAGVSMSTLYRRIKRKEAKI